MGAYNTILSVDDRINGSPVQENEIKDFNEFLIAVGMSEMRIVGRNFTRTNSHVFSRIDRAIVNAEWVTNILQLDAVIMDPVFSDHFAMCVKFGDEPKVSKPFRFFNCLAEHKDFLPIVLRAWNKHQQVEHMSAIWRKLKEVKKELKKLSITEFKAVDVKVRTARQKLHEMQKQIRTANSPPPNINEEKELKKQLEKWVNIEESIYK